MGSDEETSFLFYPCSQFKLENGLSVVFLPLPHTEVLALQMWVKTGSIHEGKYLGSGISHFVEHMVFKGTELRTYAEIFRETQAQGAKINAYTSFDRTVYTYDGHRNSLSVGLDILGDMLCCSTFPEKELAKEREVVLREINMTNDDPDDRLSQILFETAFQQHPYGYPIIGIRSIFENLTREDLQAYWQDRYAINNMTLIVAGNLTLEQVKREVNQYLGHFKPRSIAPVFIPPEPFQLAQRAAKEQGDYQLVRGVVAFKIPGIGHKDGAKLQVLANILGEGESSVLYQKMREELDLVYNIDASSWMASGQGLFCIQYTCNPDKSQAVEEALQHHLVEWTESNLTQEKIEKVYNQALMSELDTHKTVSGLAHHVGWAMVCLGDIHYPQHYLEQLRQLTPELVRSVVRKYFKPISCNLVRLEPFAETAKTSEARVDTATDGPQLLEVQGIPLVYQSCGNFPKTHLQALFLGGGPYEPSNKRGLTQLVATLLTKDTQQQSALEVAAAIESLGGQFNGFAGNNHFGLSLEVRSKDVTLAAQLLQNALLEPRFSQKTFRNEQKAQWAELKEMQDDVFFMGFQKIRRQFYQNHPYAIGQLGQIETINNITVDDCRAYHQRMVQRKHCVLSVVSSLPPETIVAHLAPLCQRMPDISSSSAAKTVDFQPEPFREEAICREQAMVFQAYPIPGMAHPDFYIGELLEELFNGLSSSFVEEVREKRGLAYTVGATRLLGVQQGMFCLFAGTQPQYVRTVQEEMHRGIQRILHKKMRSEEFKTSKACLKVNRQLRLQTIGQKAFSLGYNQLLQISLQKWLDYEKNIDHITLGEFYNKARVYLQKDQSSTLVLTPNIKGMV